MTIRLDNIADWLLQQRWFSKKDQEITDVTPTSSHFISAAKENPTWIVLADVTTKNATGTSEVFTVVLVATKCEDNAKDAIGNIDNNAVAEISSRPEAALVLARTIADHRTLPDGFKSGRMNIFPNVPIKEARKFNGEQSNTSFIIDEKIMFKLIRVYEQGPDVEFEVSRALTEAKTPGVPPFVGIIAGPDMQSIVLANTYVGDAQDGWQAALQEAMSGEEGPVLANIGKLGATLRAIHIQLGFAFGKEMPEYGYLMGKSFTETQMAWTQTIMDEMNLTTAMLNQAGIGEQERIESHAYTIATNFPSTPETKQRIHGDFHLGQTLLTQDNEWWIIDFAGEPGQTAEQQREFDSITKDIAGITRSFAYVEQMAAAQEVKPGCASEWAKKARTAFLDGYGISEIPGDWLFVQELRKRMYEVRYELANRPEWVHIPLASFYLDPVELLNECNESTFHGRPVEDEEIVRAEVARDRAIREAKEAQDYAEKLRIAGEESDRIQAEKELAFLNGEDDDESGSTDQEDFITANTRPKRKVVSVINVKPIDAPDAVNKDNICAVDVHVVGNKVDIVSSSDSLSQEITDFVVGDGNDTHNVVLLNPLSNDTGQVHNDVVFEEWEPSDDKLEEEDTDDIFDIPFADGLLPSSSSTPDGASLISHINAGDAHFPPLQTGPNLFLLNTQNNQRIDLQAEGEMSDDRPVLSQPEAPMVNTDADGLTDEEDPMTIKPESENSSESASAKKGADPSPAASSAESKLTDASTAASSEQAFADDYEGDDTIGFTYEAPSLSHDEVIKTLAEMLTRGELGSPHDLLGIHEYKGEWSARTYRPDATGVSFVMQDGAQPIEATEIHPGVFEAKVGSKQPNAGSYRWHVTYGENSFVIVDPYGFTPSVGEMDEHLWGEGRHEEAWHILGANRRVLEGINGVAFSVWAPNARAVRVIGEFNSWDGRLHAMRSLGSSGIWEIFIPDVPEGAMYQYELITEQGNLVTRADPFAKWTEVAPGRASRVFTSTFKPQCKDYQRPALPHSSAISIYEVHLGSWRHRDGRSLTYLELAEELVAYVKDLNFTHVEFMPPAEHPFEPSWGYQVTGHFAPTSRFGSPDDFRFLVDAFHSAGIGVIIDWVPAHFPKDEWALAKFDGTALFEHADPRQGEHPDWGTLVFNYGRNEVKNFIMASALFWIEEMGVDGLRVDAVASMLYLDYSRKEGEWVPNQFGGRENLEAVALLKEVNATVYKRNPNVLMIAEESTAWPGVTKPTDLDGLGFGFKWNMGWMHDTLNYIGYEPVYRKWHHNDLTFGFMYAWSENFVLPFSHDEVVHGKGSMLDKMPGDEWQRFANLRALYGWMWGHPGKQLIFMGSEFGQWREWSESMQLEWDALSYGPHAGVQRLIRDMNAVYRDQPAMYTQDHTPEGFSWILSNADDDNLLAFARKSSDDAPPVVVISNFAPVPRYDYKLGFPQGGKWREVINSDANVYGGSGVQNHEVWADDQDPWNGQPASATVTIPPLGTVWLIPE